MNPKKEMLTFGNLSKENVKIMVKRHHDFSKNPPPYNDTKHVKCVWFPIDQIKFIYNKLKDEGADGLRVYFGNYPDKDIEGHSYPNPNTNTVIFVSTKNGKKDYFTDEPHPMIPENRGEQCQPTCTGVEFINE